jgi:hypothetical protein
VEDDLARRLASVGGADVVDLERDLSAGENPLALQNLRALGHPSAASF